jgi:hypothetical protein
MCICDSFPVKDFNDSVCHRTNGRFLVARSIVAEKYYGDDWMVINGAWTFDIVDRNHINVHHPDVGVRECNYVFLELGDFARCGVVYPGVHDYNKIFEAASKVARLVFGEH